MGLDNGIRVVVKFKNGMKIEKEVCYWRKWWGLRNDIMWHIINNSESEDADAYEYPLSYYQLVDIESTLTLIARLDNDSEPYDYTNLYYSKGEFVRSCFMAAADIVSLEHFLNHKMDWLEYFEDELAEFVESNFSEEYRNNEDIIIEGVLREMEIKEIKCYFYDSY